MDWGSNIPQLPRSLQIICEHLAPTILPLRVTRCSSSRGLTLGERALHNLCKPCSSWELKLVPLLQLLPWKLISVVLDPAHQRWTEASHPAYVGLIYKIPFTQQSLFFHTLHVILWNLSEIMAYGQIPIQRIPPDLTSWLSSFSKSASLLFKMVKLNMLWYKVCWSSQGIIGNYDNCLDIDMEGF